MAFAVFGLVLAWLGPRLPGASLAWIVFSAAFAVRMYRRGVDTRAAAQARAVCLAELAALTAPVRYGVDRRRPEAASEAWDPAAIPQLVDEPEPVLPSIQYIPGVLR